MSSSASSGSDDGRERHLCAGGCGLSSPPSQRFAWSDRADGYLCQECRDLWPNLSAAWRKPEPTGGFIMDALGIDGHHSESDRYSDRVVQLVELLAQPDEPTPWRVEGIVADGTVTVISGESGDGKSWLVKGLCQGVARGESVLGLACTQGAALYVDGEMGRRMLSDRLRAAGITAPAFNYIEALGARLLDPE